MGKNGHDNTVPKRIRSTVLRMRFREVIEAVRMNGEVYVVETYGTPSAVLMSVDTYKQLQRSARREVPDRL